MQPDGAIAIPFYKQFIKLLLAFISIIHKDYCIPQRLFHATHPYIRRAARHVIAIRIPMNRLI